MVPLSLLMALPRLQTHCHFDSLGSAKQTIPSLEDSTLLYSVGPTRNILRKEGPSETMVFFCVLSLSPQARASYQEVAANLQRVIWSLTQL